MEKKRKFVGTEMPEEYSDCLRLESLLQDIAQGALMRNILISWFEDRGWTSEDLVDRFAQHLYSQWNLRFKETVEYHEYIRMTKDDLIKAKVSINLTQKIAHRCGVLKKENSAIKSRRG